MPTPRGHLSHGRRFQGRAVEGSRILVECPKCGALPHFRCFDLKSWISTGPGGEGFYTRRIEKYHPERRVRPARTPDPAVDRTRPALRRELNKLMMRKVSGSERMKLRRWIGSVDRTVDELAAKRDELWATPDLPW